MTFEHRSSPLLPRKKFIARVFRFGALALMLVLFSLSLGVLGYHYLNDLSWIDSLVNASMILTGMGPVSPLKNDVAKLFASCYAIYSGIAFLSTTAVFLSPLVHRFLHKLHFETEKDNLRG